MNLIVGGAEALRSETLGVSLRPADKRLRVRNLETGRGYPWIEESETKFWAQAAARRAAEVRLATLGALRRQTGQQQPEDSCSRPTSKNWTVVGRSRT